MEMPEEGTSELLGEIRLLYTAFENHVEYSNNYKQPK